MLGGFSIHGNSFGAVTHDMFQLCMAKSWGISSRCQSSNKNDAQRASYTLCGSDPGSLPWVPL